QHQYGGHGNGPIGHCHFNSAKGGLQRNDTTTIVEHDDQCVDRRRCEEEPLHCRVGGQFVSTSPKIESKSIEKVETAKAANTHHNDAYEKKEDACHQNQCGTTELTAKPATSIPIKRRRRAVRVAVHIFAPL